MLTVKCPGCGASYKLAEDLYSRKAAGFGVVVTCRRCKSEIHVEAPGAPHVTPEAPAADAKTETPAPAADAKAETPAPAPETATETKAPPLVEAPSEANASDEEDAPATPKRARDEGLERATEKAPNATPVETKTTTAETPKVSPVAPVKAKSLLAPRATPKATAPWPDVLAPSPAAPAAAPRAESPAPPPAAPAAAPPAESPAPPPAAEVAKPSIAQTPAAATAKGAFPRPAPRPMAPAGPKPLARRDPVSGPFVALSPGLLGAARPAEPIRDSEAPVDSSDFIDEPKKGLSPKAPPVRRPTEADKATSPKTEQKPPPPKRAAEPALPLKFKERPKPPQQKPRAPVRSDDVSDDLLSADVGFEGAPPVEAEPPRLLAPDTSALAAPAPESEKPRETKKSDGTIPSPSTSDARPRPSSTAKSSRVVPIVLVSLGAIGAFGLAFRSQLPGASAPAAEKHAPDEARPAANPPPAAAPADPPVTVPAEAEPASPPVTPSAAPVPATTVPGATSPAVAPRAGSEPSPKPLPGTPPTKNPSSTAPKPGTTAPAPGTPEPPDAPRAKPEGPFNAEAARSALAGAVAQASSCRKPGDPSGVAVVTITFSPSGRVTSANIGGPPFAGTPTGGCIAGTLRRARVPAFTGDMVTVKKTVEIH